MNRTFKYLLSVSFLFIFYGCENSYWKMQEEYLLPENNRLEIIESKEVGITIYNIYNIENDIILENLKDYPQYAMGDRGWEMIKWHKPSKEEITNLDKLMEFEDIESNLLDDIQLNEVLIAYAKSTNDVGLTKSNYDIQNWVELYFLQPKDKKLTHVSYGKF